MSDIQLYNGDCLEYLDSMHDNSVDLIVCDGPYGITSNDWDKVGSIQEYNLSLLEKFSRILKMGGTAYLFGKDTCIDFIDYSKYLTLNRKIVWFQPSRLAQGRKNYTNNYDIIAYFSKGSPKTFNLDDIRIPQMVDEGQRNRCESVPSVKSGKYGNTKYNELGKNPGDVWIDIKQLTYKSKELVSRTMLNTIQKPIKLIERLVLASSNIGDVVLDPFMGSGTTGVACKKLNRNFIGIEKDSKYFEIAKKRIEELNVTNTTL